MTQEGYGNTKLSKYDRSYTQDWVADAICRNYDLLDKIVREAGVGGGAWAKAAKKAQAAHVYGCDINDVPGAEFCDEFEKKSFLDLDIEEYQCDVVLGNPPHSQAIEFIKHGLELAPEVIFYLRLSFLGSLSRMPLWSEVNCIDVAITVPKQAFVMPWPVNEDDPDGPVEWKVKGRAAAVFAMFHFRRIPQRKTWKISNPGITWINLNEAKNAK